MYHNLKEIRASVLGLFLVSMLSLVIIGCDKILPAKFKAQNFSASTIDARAGALMTKDTLNNGLGYTIAYEYAPVDTGTPLTVIPDTLADSLPVSWTVIHSRKLASIVNNAGQMTDNWIINSNFDVLADSLPPLAAGSLILVNYPDSQNVTYAVLKATSAENVYLYTGLQYYYSANSGASNVNDFVTVDLVKKDTSTLSSSIALSPESAYGSSETILYANSPRIVPTISSRYSLHLDQGGVYVVRFTLTSWQEISNPQHTPNAKTHPAIKNQFKVVILSY